MDEEKLPESFRIALDVTEEEYLLARKQHRLLWGITFAAAILSFVLYMGFTLTGTEVPYLLVSAPAVHFGLRPFLPESSKMGTLRLRKFKELRALRAARGNLE